MPVSYGQSRAICGIFPIDIASIGKMPHKVGVSPKGAMPFGETPTFEREIFSQKEVTRPIIKIVFTRSGVMEIKNRLD